MVVTDETTRIFYIRMNDLETIAKAVSRIAPCYGNYGTCLYCGVEDTSKSPHFDSCVYLLANKLYP